jgi:hypothetical protein
MPTASKSSLFAVSTNPLSGIFSTINCLASLFRAVRSSASNLLNNPSDLS